MNIAAHNFETIHWDSIPKEEHSGETGMAIWQTVFMNDIRVRKVEYTAGYRANHWCKKGHVLLCLEGEMESELDNGKLFTLTAGMIYLVGDNSEAHRSYTERGCKLFIVD